MSDETQPPLDRRVITAAEAHREFGIPASTIRSWAHRSRILAVSIGRDGQRWYRLADILALRSPRMEIKNGQDQAC